MLSCYLTCFVIIYITLSLSLFLSLSLPHLAPLVPLPLDQTTATTPLQVAVGNLLLQIPMVLPSLPLHIRGHSILAPHLMLLEGWSLAVELRPLTQVTFTLHPISHQDLWSHVTYSPSIGEQYCPKNLGTLLAINFNGTYRIAGSFGEIFYLTIWRIG